MKIVTWNCNGALRNKLAKLQEISGVIFLIQECEDPKVSKDILLSRLNWVSDNLELYIPCKINNEYTLVAV